MTDNQQMGLIIGIIIVAIFFVFRNIAVPAKVAPINLVPEGTQRAYGNNFMPYQTTPYVGAPYVNYTGLPPANEYDVLGQLFDSANLWDEQSNF